MRFSAWQAGWHPGWVELPARLPAALGSASAENLYTAANPGGLAPATTADMIPDPSKDATWTGSSIETTLNFVGRNHGSKRLGQIQGPSGGISGWDMRKSAFLFVDGHVEMKNIADTVWPNYQWGDEFYSLTN